MHTELVMNAIDRAARRFLPAALLLAFAAWTAFWAHYAWGHLFTESIVAREGFGGDGVQMWELFNLQMALAHCLVRWAPGAAVLLGGWFYSRRRGRPASAARRRTPLVLEQDLAA
jgi:hypothetical protein